MTTATPRVYQNQGSGATKRSFPQKISTISASENQPFFEALGKTPYAPFRSGEEPQIFLKEVWLMHANIPATLHHETEKEREELPAPFISHILKVEGGYVHHPQDPGGATRYGITEKSLQKARKVLKGLPEYLRDLSPREASRIFYAFYYLPGGCSALPYPLSLAHFDGAVHCGVDRAGKLLQESLNRLYPEEEPLKTDGLVGPRTLERVFLLRSSGAFWHRLGVQELLLERMRFYGILARKSPEIYRVFLGGWLRRLEVLYDTVFPVTT